jgi:hypothetical protein
LLAVDYLKRGAVSMGRAPDNGPMQRLNRGIGFRSVELLHEVQRKDARDVA